LRPLIAPSKRQARDGACAAEYRWTVAVSAGYHNGVVLNWRSIVFVLFVVAAGAGACAGKLTAANDDPPERQDCGDPCRANICPKGARCTYGADTCHPVCEGDYMRPPPEKLEPTLLSPPGRGLFGGVP
jgi:hypothetical protein